MTLSGCGLRECSPNLAAAEAYTVDFPVNQSKSLQPTSVQSHTRRLSRGTPRASLKQETVYRCLPSLMQVSQSMASDKLAYSNLFINSVFLVCNFQWGVSYSVYVAEFGTLDF